MFHCALYQNQVDIKNKLRKSLGKKRIQFHQFDEIAQLHNYIKSHILDMIVIAGKGDFIEELQLVKNIKKHSVLSLIPLILYSPQPQKKTILAGWKAGADEFISEEWDQALISGKLKMILKRSARDLGMNPTTCLSGMGLIQKEIDRRIRKGEIFAVCYADLDNFKAYNDYYGYFYGDKLIRKTSEIIRDIVYGSCKDAFVGHIGGDDFFFLIPSEKIHPICSEVIKAFDRIILSYYKKKDLKKGFIVTKNRRGVVERFPIMTLSISVVVNKNRMFSHAGEISHMITDLKKYTKTLPGSNYVIERRKKY